MTVYREKLIKDEGKNTDIMEVIHQYKCCKKGKTY